MLDEKLRLREECSCTEYEYNCLGINNFTIKLGYKLYDINPEFAEKAAVFERPE